MRKGTGATLNRAELHQPVEEMRLNGAARLCGTRGFHHGGRDPDGAEDRRFRGHGNVSSTRQPDKKKDKKKLRRAG